jgi:hypothetical protein
MYDIRANGPSGYRALNPQQGLAVAFESKGATLQSRHGAIGFTLRGAGYGRDLRIPQRPEYLVSGHRIEYRRGDFTEWYVNEPSGVEQGFTFDHRLTSESNNPLVIELAVQGDARPSLSTAGDAVILQANGRAIGTYGGLRALDARGQEVPSRLELAGNVVRLVVSDQTAEYPLVVDPVWTLEATLDGSSAGFGAEFGFAVAYDNNTAVVGAPFFFQSIGGQGQAYVYVRNGTMWTLQATLDAPMPAPGDFFGSSVAISGNTIVVGAPQSGVNTGEAFVFVRNGTIWNLQATLTASDGMTGDQFGAAVAVDGNTIIIGAPIANMLVGAAYVFTRAATVWTQQTPPLTPNDATGFDGFGTSVGVSGTTLVVGSPYHNVSPNNQQGAAYVFTVGGGNAQFELLAMDGMPFDRFGTSVAIDVTTIVVGSPSAQSFNGAIYIFVPAGMGWMLQQELAGSGGGFGDSVSISGNVALVGAPTFSNIGMAYTYIRTGTMWTLQQQIEPPMSVQQGDGFGTSVWIRGDTLIIGAPGVPDPNAAFIYRTPSAPPMIGKKFADSTIELFYIGTKLSFTVSDPMVNSAPFTDIAFTDTLLAGLILATPSGLNPGTCVPASITAPDAGNKITVSGLTLNPGTSCTFSVNVLGIQVGPQVNTTSTVTAVGGTVVGNMATDTVTVQDLFWLWFYRDASGGKAPK